MTREADSPRSAGILLHPTSLPSPYGIGDLGPSAYAWVDQLAQAQQQWWQILPLGPTGFGDSPYQCFSVFAGNPFLISPDLLRRDGLLNESDLAGAQGGVDDCGKGRGAARPRGPEGRRDENDREGRPEHARDSPLTPHVLCVFCALGEDQASPCWVEWVMP